jgi:exodeoxyribonuclease III
MKLAITTWNINSVRLRIGLIERHVAETGPDIICLQETKCADGHFPLAAIKAMGYPHVAINGQKGYHGVAIASRLPLAETSVMGFCDKNDARHIAVRLGRGAKAANGLVVHNFYVPAGGDVPDPAVNDKFAHKLAFLDELMRWSGRDRPAASPTILVGDLNIAPYETDVWSSKQLANVVSHTPVERQALENFRGEAGFVDAVRQLKPEPERVYTWWSYRSPDWAAADKGRRLDHVWLAPALAPALKSAVIGRDRRGWERPSDHAPITVTLDI